MLCFRSARTLIILRAMKSTRAVPTVIKTAPMIIVILSVNRALTEMQSDIIMFLKTTTVDAPTEDAFAEDCRAFNTETGTRNALPMH